MAPLRSAPIKAAVVLTRCLFPFPVGSGDPVAHEKVLARLQRALFNAQKLYFENQRHVGSDLAAGAPFSIGKLRGYENLPLRAHSH
jgi:hypothetical protein